MSDTIQEIFDKYQWTTRFCINGKTYGGDHKELLNDKRLLKFNEQYSVAGKRVLELGPLEAAHTITLKLLGAEYIASIEGQLDNYYKCCMIKNLLDPLLDNCRFYYNNLETISVDALKKFEQIDVCLCCGVLYHLPKPWELLKKLSNITNRLFIWTHIATEVYPDGPTHAIEHLYAGKDYNEVPGHMLSGLSTKSFWPYFSELKRMLADAGFNYHVILDNGTNKQNQSWVQMYSYRDVQS